MNDVHHIKSLRRLKLRWFTQNWNWQALFFCISKRYGKIACTQIVSSCSCRNSNIIGVPAARAALSSFPLQVSQILENDDRWSLYLFLFCPRLCLRLKTFIALLPFRSLSLTLEWILSETFFLTLDFFKVALEGSCLSILSIAAFKNVCTFLLCF